LKAPREAAEVEDAPKTNLTSLVPLVLVPGAAEITAVPPPPVAGEVAAAAAEADAESAAVAEVEAEAGADDATPAAGGIVAVAALFHTNDGCVVAAVLDDGDALLSDCFANNAVLGLALLRLNPPMNAGAAGAGAEFATADEVTEAGRVEDGDDDSESRDGASAEDAEVLAAGDAALGLLLNSGAVGLLL
jgi:hypothetical protein